MLDFAKFKGRRLRCAGLGEVLFDLLPSGPRLGGAPANFAFHCRQNGLDAAVVSAVGRDELGEKAREELALRFVPALLLENEHETGYVKVALDEQGVPSYAFAEDTAYDNIRLTPGALEMARRLDLSCFGTLAQRCEMSRRSLMALLDAMPKASLRIFDVNLRGKYYSGAVIEDSLKRAQILKCNDEELPVLCDLAGLKNADPEEYFSYLRSRGIDCFVYTEGALQSSVWLNDEKSVLPTPQVAVADTVGAGDAFTATLLSQLMLGRGLKKAHTLAVNAAAFVCTREGAMPEIPQELLR
jgi:fructokinase